MWNTLKTPLTLPVILLVVFCGCSYSDKTDVKFETRTADGYEYMIGTTLKFRRIQIGSVGSPELSLKTTVYRDGKPIYFEADHHSFPFIDFSETQHVQIDSVTYQPGERTDLVRLTYYFTVDGEPADATLLFQETDGRWVLNKD